MIETVTKRRNLNNQYIYKNMFDFIKHQGNLKENYNEMSLHFTRAMN